MICSFSRWRLPLVARSSTGFVHTANRCRNMARPVVSLSPPLPPLPPLPLPLALGNGLGPHGLRHRRCARTT
eukprot:6393039-Lingulodinium_polyedra.AAC.1